MYLERIRDYGPNFGLYKVIIVHDFDRVMDNSGRTIPEKVREGQVVGVSEINFAGAARGRSGRHAINEDNTEIIYAEDLKKVDGKYNAHKWALLNQQEVDLLYQQRVAYSI